MILTKDNLQEWKVALDKEYCEAIHEDIGESLSSTLYDEQWLEEYLGEDTKDVVAEELSYMA